jgi:hypothetical protein
MVRFEKLKRNRDISCEYAALVAMLRQMEHDLGLSNFNEVERNIIAAVCSLHNLRVDEEFIRSRDIRTHKLCVNIPEPTFFRALKKLTDSQKLTMPNGRKKGLYKLISN